MTKANAFNRKVYDTTESDKVISAQGSKFTGKVFLYMFIALAITAVTCAICGAIIRQAMSGNQNSLDIFAYVLVGSFIAYIPIILWTQISILRGGKGLAPAFVIYSIIMGVILSSFVALLPFDIVAIAFGLTCAAFGIMALIAWTSKKNLSALAVVGLGFLSGAALISLMALIMSLVGLESGTIMLSTLVSGGIFIFVILITIVDLFNIRQIAARGIGSSNLAMVCAFSLYTDFIYIFLRILIWLIRILSILGLTNRR